MTLGFNSSALVGVDINDLAFPVKFDDAPLLLFCIIFFIKGPDVCTRMHFYARYCRRFQTVNFCWKCDFLFVVGLHTSEVSP